MTPASTLLQRDYDQYVLRYYSSDAPIGSLLGKDVIEDLQIGLPEFNVRQYFGTQPTIFTDYEHAVLARDRSTDRTIGLLGARWLGAGSSRFLYLWTAMVADAHRGSALFNRVLQHFFLNVIGDCGGNVPDLIVTKTYNPVVYCIFRSVASRSPAAQLYPQIPGDQPANMRKLASEVISGINSKLTLHVDTGVVPGGQASVAPDFFPYMEAAADDEVNRHFAVHLTRADQILCIIRIPPEARHSVKERLTGIR